MRLRPGGNAAAAAGEAFATDACRVCAFRAEEPERQRAFRAAQTRLREERERGG